MPVEIKHYIDAHSGLRGVIDAELGAGLFLEDWSWVKATDLSKATDIEKFRYLLEAVGLECWQFPNGDGLVFHLDIIKFDSNGRLIR